MRRACLDCEFWFACSAIPDYTLGSNFNMGCNRSHWREFDEYEADENFILEEMARAETCEDFSERRRG